MLHVCAGAATRYKFAYLILLLYLFLIGVDAGNGTIGYTGGDVLAQESGLDGPVSCAFDTNTQDLYIVDSNRILLVTQSSSIISTYAGIGTPGFNGDGYSAPLSQLSAPLNVQVYVSYGERVLGVRSSQSHANKERGLFSSQSIKLIIAGKGDESTVLGSCECH